jgi:hypothetical protein
MYDKATIFSMSSVIGIKLHNVQRHVSVLCIGHHQVVLKLIKQLYYAEGFWGCGGGDEKMSRTPTHMSQSG